MIDRNHRLALTKQAALLGISNTLASTTLVHRTRAEIFARAKTSWNRVS
jgi:hypothetical protein